MVPFGGWEMPVQYTSILEEARAVRRTGGIFDLCHMGRLTFDGPEAEAVLQMLVTNDVTKIKPGVIRYALLSREDGGVLDDVLVYRDPETPASFFVVVNASNTDKDLAWMRQHAGQKCRITDRTAELAMLALQGPASLAVLAPLVAADLASLGYYKWLHGRLGDLECDISRTGYTGEDGFELYFPVARAGEVWDRLLESGRPHGLIPVGLGARDTLRLEAGMALYGHELTEDINPLEAGLDWAVKLDKPFLGRDALVEVQRRGPRRRLIGLVTDSRRVPRQGYPVLAGDREVGWIASGTFSPFLEKNIATAFVTPEHAAPGTDLAFRVRDAAEAARVVPLPFYKRSK
jgi:aminomethyltransferase